MKKLVVGEVYASDTGGYALVLSAGDPVILKPRPVPAEGPRQEGQYLLLITSAEVDRYGSYGEPGIEYPPAPDLLEGWTLARADTEALPDYPGFELRAIDSTHWLTDCGGIEGARKREAERRRDAMGRALDHVDDAWDEAEDRVVREVAHVYARRDWEPLGLASGEEYLRELFRERLRFLADDRRKKMVRDLAEVGLTVRAIEATTGTPRSSAYDIIRQAETARGQWDALTKPQQNALLRPDKAADLVIKNMRSKGLVTQAGRIASLTDKGRELLDAADFHQPEKKTSVGQGGRRQPSRKARKPAPAAKPGMSQQARLTEEDLRARLGRFLAEMAEHISGHLSGTLRYEDWEQAITSDWTAAVLRCMPGPIEIKWEGHVIGSLGGQ